MKAETAHAFAQPGSTDAPRAAAGTRRRDFQHLLAGLRARAARGDEPDRLSRGLPRRSGHDGERGRAHDRRDRRAGRRRHRQGPAPRPHLPQPHDQALSLLRRLLRHGRHDRAHRRLLPARRAGARGAQADPLSAWPGRRRQVVARRAAQGADGDAADLRAEGRRRDQPGVRIAARPVPPGDDGRPCSRAATAFPRGASPASDRPGRPSGSTTSAATSPSSRSSSSIRRSCARSASPRPSRATRTTRTSRPWSARSTSASSSISASTTRTPTATPAA